MTPEALKHLQTAIDTRDLVGSLVGMIGSRAYGTETETSDWDFRGFFLPTAENLLSMNDTRDRKLQILNDTYDVTLWDVRKFYQMAVNGNPNILDALFSTGYYGGDLAEMTSRLRDGFVSKKSASNYFFYGRNLRDEFWADSKDFKTGMNAVRVLTSAQEQVLTGTIRVNRTGIDATWLRAIRAGEVDPKEVLAWCDERIEKFPALLDNCKTLPETPNIGYLDNVLCNGLRDILGIDRKPNLW